MYLPSQYLGSGRGKFYIACFMCISGGRICSWINGADTAWASERCCWDARKINPNLYVSRQEVSVVLWIHFAATRTCRHIYCRQIFVSVNIRA